MESLDQRERILLIVLGGLLLLAGVYYSGSLVSGLQGVIESGGMSPTNSTQILDDSAAIRESILRRHQRDLKDFVGVSSPELFWGTEGWSGTFDVRLRTGSDPNADHSFEGSFRGSVFTEGLLEGTLRSESDSWIVRSGTGSLYFDEGSDSKYQLADVQFRNPPSFSMVLNELEETDIRDVKSKNWRGKPVYVMNVDVDRGSGRLYVTRNEPRRVLEYILESDFTWGRQFDYAEGDSDRLVAIRTYRDQRLIESYYQDDGDTRTLVYRSRRSSTPAEVLRLNYVPGGKFLNLRFEARRSPGEEPFLTGFGRLETSPEGLESLELETVWTTTLGSTVPIHLDVNADELSHEDNRKQKNVENQRSYEDVSPRKFFRVITADSPAKRPSDTSDSPVIQTAGDTQGDEVSSMDQEKLKKEKIDWPEAPEQSGETVVKNSTDGSPRSIPPEGFDRPRRLYESGELDRAAVLLEDLSETYPKSANVRFLLGVIAYERGRSERAAQYFRRVTQFEHDPQLRAWSRTYLQLLERRREGS